MGTVQPCPVCSVMICGHAFAAMQGHPYDRRCGREDPHEAHEYETGVGVAFWCDGGEGDHE